MAKVNVNDYVYRYVLKKINYCEGAKGAAVSETGYHPDFSPDNIRRVFIAPDSVYVQYCVKTAHNNRSTELLLDANSVLKAQQTEDYIPAIQALVKPYVCSSIQEIIFVENSEKGLNLIPKDKDLTILVKSYTGSGSALASRFKRLAYVSSFRGTMSQVKEIIQSYNEYNKVNKPKIYNFAEYDLFKNNCSNIMPVNEEWYKHIIGGMTADKYAMNKKDGALNAYSYKLRDSILKAKENSGFEAYKKEKQEQEEKDKEKKEKIHTSAITKFESKFAEYKRYFGCFVRLYTNLAKFSNVMIDVSDTACVLNPATLPKVELIKTSIYNDKDSAKYGIVLVEDDTLDATQQVMKNVALLDKAIDDMYSAYLNSFLDHMNEANSSEQSYFKAILKSFKRTIKIMPECEQNYSVFANKYKLELKGIERKDSVANLCNLFVLCFITRQDNAKYYKYIKKDTWLDFLTEKKDVQSKQEN